IYQLFERSQAENDRRSAEADRRWAEADWRSAEADRRAAAFRADFEQSKLEFDRRMAEEDRRAAAFRYEFEQSKLEFDRRISQADRLAAAFRYEFEQSKLEFDRSIAQSRAEFKQSLTEFRHEFKQSLAESRAEFKQSLAESRAEFDRRHAEVEKIAAKALQSVDGLSSRWGRFVENMVEPAIVRLFQEKNIAVKETHTRVKAKRGSINMEVDILAVDDTVAVAVEVKSRLTQKHINNFVKRLGQFKTAFPAYHNYQIYGAVAAIEIDGGADTYAYNQGLFIIKQSGDMVKIENDTDFQPVNW
ncbi:MAG: hypothetical protein ACOYME_04835, partial [Prochlorotrichaceae cyanobacterium]